MKVNPFHTTTPEDGAGHRNVYHDDGGALQMESESSPNTASAARADARSATSARRSPDSRLAAAGSDAVSQSDRPLRMRTLAGGRTDAFSGSRISVSPVEGTQSTQSAIP